MTVEGAVGGTPPDGIGGGRLLGGGGRTDRGIDDDDDEDVDAAGDAIVAFAFSFGGGGGGDAAVVVVVTGCVMGGFALVVVTATVEDGQSLCIFDTSIDDISTDCYDTRVYASSKFTSAWFVWSDSNSTSIDGSTELKINANTGYGSDVYVLMFRLMFASLI